MSLLRGNDSLYIKTYSDIRANLSSPLAYFAVLLITTVSRASGSNRFDPLLTLKRIFCSKIKPGLCLL